MKILIATKRLTVYAGLETFVRDLALGLERRGHAAIVWSNGSFDGVRPFTDDGVRVSADLDNLPFVPDVIHGQLTGDTMTALTRLSNVPVLYHCHSGGPHSVPPVHPRVYRYAAMSPTLALRLAAEHGIAPADVDIVLNGVDLARFQSVRTPAPRPERALFYNNYHRRDSRTLAAIRSACEACGTMLDCVGRAFGNTTEHPEHLLPQYDLVFASGRSAIDAIASGCAVVTLGMTSCGELITLDNLDRRRRANFSVAVNTALPTPDRVRREIARYSAAAAAAVTERLRREADAMKMVEQIEALYAKVIAAHRAARQDLRAEQLAVARMLRKMTPMVRLSDEHQARGFMPLRTAAATRGMGAAIEKMGRTGRCDETC